MKNNGYEHYILNNGKKEYVNEETDKFYKHEKNNMRRNMNRRGECVCPQEKWFACCLDCNCCKYHKTSNIYFDGIVSEDGNAFGEEYIALRNPDLYLCSAEETAVNREIARVVLKCINELMPELIWVKQAELKGKSECEVLKALHIKRSTFYSRKIKVLAQIKKEFGDIFA